MTDDPERQDGAPEPDEPTDFGLPDPPKWDYKRPAHLRKKNEETGERGLGIGITVAYMLVGCMLAGWGVGWLIDRARGTGGNEGQAFAALAGCLVGIAGTFWLINQPDPKGK